MMKEKYIEFYKNIGKGASWRLDNPGKFFDIIEETRDELRTLIGGRFLVLDINVPSNPSAYLNNFRNEMRVIDSSLPYLVQDLRIKKEGLVEKTILIKDAKKPVKTDKAVISYAKEKQVKPKAIHGIITSLAEIHNKHERLKDGGKFDTIKLLIDTRPEAFSMPGRFNIDNCSCFSDGSFNSEMKYTVALHSNSFVYLTFPSTYKDYEDHKDIMKQSDVVTGRGFGIYKPNDRVLFINQKGYNINHGLILTEAFQYLLKCKTKLNHTSAGFNTSGRMTYYDNRAEIILPGSKGKDITMKFVDAVNDFVKNYKANK